MRILGVLVLDGEGEVGGVRVRRDEPLWPKREVSGTAPRTAKDGVVKNVLIAAGVAGIVLSGRLSYSHEVPEIPSVGSGLPFPEMPLWSRAWLGERHRLSLGS